LSAQRAQITVLLTVRALKPMLSQQRLWSVLVVSHYSSKVLVASSETYGAALLTLSVVYFNFLFSGCLNTAEIEELSLRTPRPVATTE